jgi:hypothetical protein
MVRPMLMLIRDAQMAWRALLSLLHWIPTMPCILGTCTLQAR